MKCNYLPQVHLKEEPFISFFDSLRKFSVEATDLIVGGDHNIHLLKVSLSDSLAVQFYNPINSLSIVPRITRPTRIAGTSWSLLDKFLVTNLRNFKTVLRSINVTDHLPIFLIYESYFDSIKLLPKEIEYRVMNELTLENFCRKFSL